MIKRLGNSYDELDCDSCLRRPTRRAAFISLPAGENVSALWGSHEKTTRARWALPYGASHHRAAGLRQYKQTLTGGKKPVTCGNVNTQFIAYILGILHALSGQFRLGGGVQMIHRTVVLWDCFFTNLNRMGAPGEPHIFVSWILYRMELT